MNKWFLVWILAGLPFLIVAQGQPRIPQSIDKALCYLAANESDISYNNYFLLTWLKGKYDLKWTGQQDFDTLKPQYPDELAVYNFYNSILAQSNKQTVDSLKRHFRTTSDLEKLLLWASNAKDLPFENNCDIVSKYAMPGTNVRQTAHVALAFSWAAEDMDTSARLCFETHKSELIAALEKGIAREELVSDNWLEGIMGLICLKEQKRIPDEWIRMLLKAQNNDGGWCWDPKDSEGSEIHPTVLAVWVLLDYQERLNKK